MAMMSLRHLVLSAVAVLFLVSLGQSARLSNKRINESRSSPVRNVTERLFGPKNAPKNVCGYFGCPRGRPDKLNIHIVAHTHDDVGWLKTVDEYYYGLKSNIQRAGVQYILDTVIEELVKDPNRKFIYVETAFFWKWWNQQSDVTKLLVIDLVETGRLEFIGGGWSMNDEATCHYISSIDQMTWGHRQLVDTFGQCGRPRVAWQIDPFGHSREQASLWAQMNFDGLFFGRLDWNDKTKRENEKRMEFVWHGSDDLGSPVADLFTGVLPNGYNPPDGFCFDVTCGDDPIVADPESGSYNADKKVDAFLDAAHQQAKVYGTNHLIMTMGTDFNYQAAGMWFKNLDLIIKLVNEKNTDVNVFYSTPSCYLLALNNANKTWTTKNDDFFPYASDQHAYWTGYFTSRPALKYFERRGNNYLQNVKQMQTAAWLDDPMHNKQVENLKEAMGINQHHDALTGTEKQLVAYDYARLLNIGVVKGETVINDAYARLQPLNKGVEPLRQGFCHAFNISECAITESTTANKLAVTLWNPRSLPISTLVRLPVLNGTAYTVSSGEGQTVNSELVDIPEYVQTIPGRSSKATRELLFEAQLPAVGFSTYFVEKKTQGTGTMDSRRTEQPKDEPVQFNGKTFSVNFAPNGELLGIKLANGQSVQLKQDFRYYESMAGNNSATRFRASGAYIFRPNGTTAYPVTESGQLQAEFKQNNMVQSVHQRWSNWIKQTINVYPDKDIIEFDFVIGPIPVDDKIGKEVISYFSTNLTTAKTFYTDSAGRQMLKRVRDFRPTWPYVIYEPVAGNYYPINSKIALRDEQAKLQLSVLTDRSVGAASIMDGDLEIMVHRRMLYDDAFGVGEPLNEPGFDGKGLVIRGKQVLLLNSFTDAHVDRDLAMSIALAPQVTLAPYQDQAQYRSQYRTNFSAIRQPLPDNVHLLTHELWKEGTILVRLEHFYQENDDPNGLSKPAKVDLSNLIENGHHLIGALETTLSATELLAEARRLKWHTTDDMMSNEVLSNGFHPLTGDANDFTVILKPMQIRTFVLILG